MKEIYVVSLDWSCDDSKGLDIYAFSTYQAAYEKFDSLIKEESDSDISWVGELAFDEKGCVQSGYDVSTNDLDDRKEKQENLYWNVDDLYNYNRYSYIRLDKKELLGD